MLWSICLLSGYLSRFASSVILISIILRVVSGLFPSIGADSSIFTSRVFWVSVCMWIVSPFAFAKTLSSLKYVSAFALSFVFYLALLVVYFYVETPTSTRPPDIRLAHIDSHFFLNLPIFVFAFTCHQNVNFLLIYHLRYSQFIMKSGTILSKR
jgi:amino acid permease